MFSLCVLFLLIALGIYLLGAFTHTVPGELMTLCLIIIVVAFIGLLWQGFTGHAYFGRW